MAEEKKKVDGTVAIFDPYLLFRKGADGECEVYQESADDYGLFEKLQFVLLRNEHLLKSLLDFLESLITLHEGQTRNPHGRSAAGYLFHQLGDLVSRISSGYPTSVSITKHVNDLFAEKGYNARDLNLPVRAKPANGQWEDVLISFRHEYNNKNRYLNDDERENLDRFIELVGPTSIFWVKTHEAYGQAFERLLRMPGDLQHESYNVVERVARNANFLVQHQNTGRCFPTKDVAFFSSTKGLDTIARNVKREIDEFTELHDYKVVPVGNRGESNVDTSSVYALMVYSTKPLWTDGPGGFGVALVRTTKNQDTTVIRAITDVVKTTNRFPVHHPRPRRFTKRATITHERYFSPLYRHDYIVNTPAGETCVYIKEGTLYTKMEATKIEYAYGRIFLRCASTLNYVVQLQEDSEPRESLDPVANWLMLHVARPGHHPERGHHVATLRLFVPSEATRLIGKRYECDYAIHVVEEHHDDDDDVLHVCVNLPGPTVAHAVFGGKKQELTYYELRHHPASKSLFSGPFFNKVVADTHCAGVHVFVRESPALERPVFAFYVPFRSPDEGTSHPNQPSARQMTLTVGEDGTSYGTLDAALVGRDFYPMLSGFSLFMDAGRDHVGSLDASRTLLSMWTQRRHHHHHHDKEATTSDNDNNWTLVSVIRFPFPVEHASFNTDDDPEAITVYPRFLMPNPLARRTAFPTTLFSRMLIRREFRHHHHEGESVVLW